MTQIKTERLVIRRFKAEDWRDLHQYLSNPNVVKFEPYGVFSEEASKQEAINRTENEAFWAVCLKNGKLIGNLYLGKQDFDTWVLGYVFNDEFQNNGYATESAKAILNYAFTCLGARRIIALCNPLNIASWKLLERLEMRREGHLLKNIYFRTDESNQPIWQDTYEYAMLSEEWENRGA